MANPEDALHEFIKQFIAENQYPPSYREMAEAIGVNSTRTISRYLQRLKDRGLVEWTPRRYRTVRLIE
jgi:SOS-response transcriptional repressor LexA